MFSKTGGRLKNYVHENGPKINYVQENGRKNEFLEGRDRFLQERSKHLKHKQLRNIYQLSN